MPNITLLLAILALLTGTYCLWQTISLNRLRKKFFTGSESVDLETIIRALEVEVKNGQERQAYTEEALRSLEHNSTFSIQKLGLVRFNPFGDGGGNFSFSLALLDAHNNGMVLTSMHGRQQNRIYTKKILNGKSEMQLTEEETQAIHEANIKL